jgi:hypothetical protein
MTNNGEILDSYEGLCQGCGCFGQIDDVGLCGECAGKLERDLIRQRDWDYAVSAYDMSSQQREELRGRVIGQFGESLELISSTKKANKRRKSRKG